MLEDLQPPKKVWPCAVRSMVATLSEKDGKILLDAVMNPEWNYAALETALVNRGLKLAANTIKRHRSKGCSCWKI
jgi:hypothetical protein